MSRPVLIEGSPDVVATALPLEGSAHGTQDVRSSWRAALVLVVIGLAGLGVLFAEEVAAAVRVWDSSAAYNHCWLILPIAAWLAWTRRDRLEGLQPSPMPVLAVLAIPVGVAWLGAERLGIMEGRQFTALALVYVLLLSVLGWRICRAMAAPLLYLVFLVPFGAFATPLLQRITAWMIEVGLTAMDIPHYVDELIIETTAGTFLVAEACAGLRFLIAALAFGALYAVVMFRSPGRRLAVFALALVVPIVANGIRAFGIVLLGHYLGSAEAAAADHVLYGWVFFSIVILLLIIAGLPFREDGAPEPRRLAPKASARTPAVATLVTATVLALALAAAAPVAAYSLQQAGARDPERVMLRLAAMEGCGPAAQGESLQCGNLNVSVQATVFPTEVTWSRVSMERWRLSSGSDQDIQFTVRTPGAILQARQSREDATTVAVAIWLNGQQVGSGLRGRAEQGWNSVVGGRGVPVLVAITVRPEEQAGTVLNGPRQRALVEGLLQAQGQQIVARAAALSRGAPSAARSSAPAGGGQAGG